MKRFSINKIGFEIEGEFSDVVKRQMEKFGDVGGDGSLRSCRNADETNHYLLFGNRSSHKDRLGLYEFRSNAIPIKDLKKSIKPIFTVLERAWKNGLFHTNDSCGFHVHLSFTPNFVPQLYSRQFVAFFKKKALATFPKETAKRLLNTYCGEHQDGVKEFIRANRHESDRRYRFINLWPAWKKHGTVEVRLWPGDEPARMMEYLLFTIETFNHFLRLPVKAQDIKGTAKVKLFNETAEPRMVSHYSQFAQVGTKFQRRRKIEERFVNLANENNFSSWDSQITIRPIADIITAPQYLNLSPADSAISVNA